MAASVGPPCARECAQVFSPKEVCLMCACSGLGFSNCSNQPLFDPACFCIKLVLVSFENDTLLCGALIQYYISLTYVPMSLNKYLIILSFLEMLEDTVCCMII